MLQRRIVSKNDQYKSVEKYCTWYRWQMCGGRINEDYLFWVIQIQSKHEQPVFFLAPALWLCEMNCHLLICFALDSLIFWTLIDLEIGARLIFQHVFSSFTTHKLHTCIGTSFLLSIASFSQLQVCSGLCSKASIAWRGRAISRYTTEQRWSTIAKKKK